MMDPIRRKILKTSAAATVMAAARRVFGQQTGQGGVAMSFYEKGPVRIHYEEFGSGFPLCRCGERVRTRATNLPNIRLETDFRTCSLRLLASSVQPLR